MVPGGGPRPPELGMECLREGGSQQCDSSDSVSNQKKSMSINSASSVPACFNPLWAMGRLVGGSDPCTKPPVTEHPAPGRMTLLPSTISTLPAAPSSAILQAPVAVGACYVIQTPPLRPASTPFGFHNATPKSLCIKSIRMVAATFHL